MTEATKDAPGCCGTNENPSKGEKDASPPPPPTRVTFKLTIALEAQVCGMGVGEKYLVAMGYCSAGENVRDRLVGELIRILITGGV